MIATQLNIGKSSFKTLLKFRKYGCLENLSPSLEQGRSRILIFGFADNPSTRIKFAKRPHIYEICRNRLMRCLPG